MISMSLFPLVALARLTESIAERKRRTLSGICSAIQAVLIAALALVSVAIDSARSEQDDTTGPSVVAGTVVSPDTQRSLGLVTVSHPASGGACSGTLLNRYWVITADHCIRDGGGQIFQGPYRQPSEMRITAAWSTAQITPTRFEVPAMNVRDVALIYLGGGDFGSVTAQPIPSQAVSPGLSVTKYGRGIYQLATATAPVRSDGQYRTAAFTVSTVTSTYYVLPTNNLNQVGGFGDSGGSDWALGGIVGVQSTCSGFTYAAGHANDNNWVTSIARCESEALQPIRSQIVSTIQESPTPQMSVSPAGPIILTGTKCDGFTPGAAQYSIIPSTGSINWSVTNVPIYFDVTPATSGTTSSGITLTFTANVRAQTLLPIGTHNFTINFNNSTGQGDTTRVITLVVNQCPDSLIVDGSLETTSTGIFGGPFEPSSFSNQVRASSGTINFAIDTTKLPSWLNASPTAGTVTNSSTANVVFTVNNNANSLGAGTYGPFSIDLKNTTNDRGNVTHNVTLKVHPTGTPKLIVTPAGGITTSGNVGGPFSPSSTQYQVSTSTGSTGFSISGVPAWLNASVTSGTATTSATNITFSINANANSLTAGTYSGALTFSNTSTNFGTQTRSVSLHVLVPELVLSVSVSGDGLVTSSPGNISCPGNCTGSFANGTTVKLFASGRKSGTGTAFAGWGGACSGNACSVVMNQAKSVAATFTCATSDYNTRYPDYGRGLAFGSDGALWFVGNNLASPLGRMTTEGTVTLYPRSMFGGMYPSGGIVGGPDGALWFQTDDGQRSALTRMTTAGAVTHFFQSGRNPGGTPKSITVGPDGALWSVRPDAVVRTTTTGVSTIYSTGSRVNGNLSITSGPDGALWFTKLEDNAIGRVTTGGVLSAYSIPTSNSSPLGIAAGPDGALWFTEGNGGEIGRITTAGAITENTKPSMLYAGEIIAGPDGALWYNFVPQSNQFPRGIGRMTLGGVFSECNLQSYISASNLIQGPAGTIWFSQQGYTGPTDLILSRLVAPVVSASHDFGRDGKSDIVWRDTGGNTTMWLMSGASIVGGGNLGNPGGTWAIVGQRDFNGDGKHDLLWKDNAGNLAMWFMNGTTPSYNYIMNVGPNWSVVGTGDFDGDGKGDILWRDTAGNVAMWLMNGTTIAGGAGFGDLSAWSVAAVADFDGDGKSDILWKDASGNVVLWYMNGAALRSATYVAGVGNSWSVAATGDFDGNGRADIVWRDATNNIALWLMNGSSIIGGNAYGNMGPWIPQMTGDYNGDGMSDILWKDSAGNVVMWFMNGAAIASAAYAPGVGTAWRVQAANAN